MLLLLIDLENKHKFVPHSHNVISHKINTLTMLELRLCGSLAENKISQCYYGHQYFMRKICFLISFTLWYWKNVKIFSILPPFFTCDCSKGVVHFLAQISNVTISTGLSYKGFCDATILCTLSCMLVYVAWLHNLTVTLTTAKFFLLLATTHKKF